MKLVLVKVAFAAHKLCPRGEVVALILSRANNSLKGCARGVELPQTEERTGSREIDLGDRWVTGRHIGFERLRGFKHLFPAIQSNPTFDLLQSYRWDERLRIRLCGGLFEKG